MNKVKEAFRRFAVNGPIKGMRLWWLNQHFPDAHVDSFRVHLDATLAAGVRVAHDTRVGADVSMGRHSYVMPYSILLCADIGNFCSIGSYVSIGGWQHPYRFATTSPLLYRDVLNTEYNDTGKRVTIGDDVWIGDGAIVLSSNIGDGAIIAAGAVVTKDVPPYEIWGGVPARRIGERFNEGEQRLLEELSWTKWSDADILSYAELFLSEENWHEAARIIHRLRSISGGCVGCKADQ